MANPTKTPFFPCLRAQLAPPVSRIGATVKTVAASTLTKLEDRFGSSLPSSLFRKAPGRRDRIYTSRRTFWCFLWQILNPGTPCREVVRQVQALFKLSGGKSISEEDGAYCRARQRLPASLFPKALAASAKAVQQQAPLAETGFLGGRPVKVLDGTTVTMPDTPKNQEAFPKTQATHDGIGFPMMRVVVLFCLTSGAILSMLSGNFHSSEVRLFHQMIAGLTKNDIVVSDRGFAHYVLLYLMQAVGADLIGRCPRKVDGRRRRRRLGRNDWEMLWHRSANQSAFLSDQEWALIPRHLKVRIVRGSLWRPGYRVRQMTLVTTLLDSHLYPAKHILQAYARRWNLELCIDDLKTSLGMEMLSCQSPDMVQKELLLHLIAHNLIRLVIAQAASIHQRSIEHLSFKGTMDGLRQFCVAISQARNRRQRAELWDEFLRVVAADSIPQRPNRREPRAVKRQKNKYPRLDRPRHLFRDRPKRTVRHAQALRRNASTK